MNASNARFVNTKYKIAGIRHGWILTPSDPFFVYQNLLKIYSGRDDVVFVEKMKERVDLYKLSCGLFRELENGQPSMIQSSFMFHRFIISCIPDVFWQYNVLLEQNREKIGELAQQFSMDSQREMWIDTPGVKRKVKRTPITQFVLQNLVHGNLVIPNHEKIVEEVKKEWKSVYNYGNIKETNMKVGEFI